MVVVRDFHKLLPFTCIVSETSQIRLYVQASDADVDYLVDTASLTAFSLSPTWKDEANQRIEDIRKNDITIKYVYYNVYTLHDFMTYIVSRYILCTMYSATIEQ